MAKSFNIQSSLPSLECLGGIVVGALLSLLPVTPPIYVLLSVLLLSLIGHMAWRISKAFRLTATKSRIIATSASILVIGSILTWGYFARFVASAPPAIPPTDVHVSGNNSGNLCGTNCTQTIQNMIPQGPTYNGLLLSPKGGQIPIVQIGPGGTKFVWLSDPNKATFFTFFGLDDLTVRAVNGKLLVSTAIHEKDGRLVSEIIDNEWKIAPPGIWDRNYTGDALEVKGPGGDITLQIKVLADAIQIQGEWWGPDGKGVRLVGRPGGSERCILDNNSQSHPCQKIKPMFLYPSETHFGELIKD